jgi:Cdc6-like AAA superfamily ATPase
MSPAIGSPDALDRRGDQAALRPIENLLPAASPRPEKRARSAECDASDAGVKPAKARDVFRNPASGDEAQPLGREQEYQQISAAVTDFAACGLGSSMYVSGLPGTGKSHTVRKALLAAANAADQPAYSICWVNCMAAGGAAEVYGQLAACVTRGASSGVGGAGAEDAPSSSGSGRATLKQVLAALTDSTCSSSSNSSAQASGSASARLGRKRRRSSTAQAQAGQPPRIVLVLDEIDALVAKGQQDVYDLFMLPRHPGVQVGGGRPRTGWRHTSAPLR